MNKLSEKYKRVLCYLGLVVVFILVGNSNNIPDTFANRIFKPLTFGSSTFYYSVLIIMAIIYFSLKGLNDIKENRYLKTFSNRFVVAVLLIIVFSMVWIPIIELYKSFSKDLNAIYLNRKYTTIEVNKDEDKLTVSGDIDLVNCSRETQEFYIKIKTPSIAKDDINKSYIILKEPIKMEPKERKSYNINEEIEFDKANDYSGYNVTVFEYILFNKEDEVIFKGNIDDYSLDNLDN